MPYATFVPRGVHTNISFISYLKGDYENALQHANTAIMIDPYDSFAHINLGCAYYATNNIDTALKEFNEASEINPDAIQGLYNAGMVFFRR